MSSGYQAGGQKWVGFDDCEDHIATEGASCPHCKIESLRAEIEALRKDVFLVLEGFTLPNDVRKILEAAYYRFPAPPDDQTGDR